MATDSMAYTGSFRLGRAIYRCFARPSSPAWRGILIAALAPLAVRLICLPWVPIPAPRIHDEFSYLLAADTFSQGRLTNPAHPLWEFFESIHIIHKPTYMSMYPCLQGMTMAFGQVLFGHPWWGVFLSVGAMCGTACWMLQAWTPPAWALVGALLMGVQFGTGHYWMDSYWGGAVSATAGCLVLGAWGRLRRLQSFSRRSSFLALILGLGVGMLANSRPWEGMLFSIPVGVAFLSWTAFRGPGFRRERLWRVFLPCAVVLFFSAAFMMYNNWRVTSDPLKLPYLLNRETYAIAPVFPWEQTRPPPHYRHAVLEEFYTEWEPTFQGAHTFMTRSGWVLPSLLKLKDVVEIGGGTAFVVPVLLFLVPLWRRRDTRFLLLTVAFFCSALLLQRYLLPHYLGPILGALTVIKVAGLRRLLHFHLGARRLGILLAPLLILGGAAVGLGNAGIVVPDCLELHRPRLAERLENLPGRDLVVVHYSNEHNVHCEWVYNAADIDAAEIVWAREMSPERNRVLFDYFRDRRVWLLEADAQPPQLTPLTSPDAANGTRQPLP